MYPKLSFLDRYLGLWIFLAMLLGIRFNIMHVSIPAIVVPIGLIAMMYPPFASVQYEMLPTVFRDVKLLGLSILQNWLIGPLLMFGLAVLFLPHRPQYFAGLVFIGLARCIAMVVVWSDIARGDREYTAALVALNAIFQIFTYGPLAYLFVTLLPPLIGLPGLAVHLSTWDIARNVGTYLGVPFLAGAITQALLRPRVGKAAYDHTFAPRIAPLTIIALLFTIFVMFSLQGARILTHPTDALIIAVPLAIYFIVMFAIAFASAKFSGANYERTTALALAAASNNFELAIAVCIALFGIDSGAAFATIIGPLVEVPLMLLLVRVSLALRKRCARRL